MIRSSAASGCDIEYVGFLTGHGGDAIQMLLLAEGMHRAGSHVRITIPATEFSVGFAQECSERGIECVRTELIAASMKGARQRIRSMLVLCRSLNAPIVHVHTGNSVLPRSLTLALEFFRRPRIVTTMQSPYETIASSSWRARTWASSVRTRIAAVVSPSDHGSRFQIRCGLPPNRIVTIRNAVDTSAMAAGDGADVRTELGLTHDQPLIVFTSRLDPQKRPVDAVRVLARVSEGHPDARLVFVGTGSEADHIESAARDLGIADRVVLAGHRSDIPDWLAAATVWILPTERENFSVAVLEALAAGCPVLSTICPGNDEVLLNQINALTFLPGDIEHGAQQLDRLLDDAELRARLSSEARRTASDHSLDTMVREYQFLYERVSV